jgi:hypothetical protein
MRRNLLLIPVVFSLVLILSQLGFSQVNEYSLVPVNLQIGPEDSTVQVNINIKTVELLYGFYVPLFAEGTCNPVLDTVLTGGLSNANPPAFYPPSLVSGSAQRIVNPYGPPLDPIWFFSYHQEVDNDSGLWCRMFYRVSGPGTLTFRTARTSYGDTVCMFNGLGARLINWPTAGEVGSFNVTGPPNEFSLDPVDLRIFPCDSTVQVNVNIKTVDPRVEGIALPLIAGGTCNPVLDTVLTGGLQDPFPPAFHPPSLVSQFLLQTVNPYGPPDEPMLFWVFTTDGGIINPTEGLFCRMFFKVSGPGTLTFKTAVHPTGGPVRTSNYTGDLPVNWHDSGEVGSFNVYLQNFLHGNANCDEEIDITDVIYIIAYLFKGGESPSPFEAGDANCDGKVNVSDVVYLINYFFKGGPPPTC